MRCWPVQSRRTIHVIEECPRKYSTNNWDHVTETVKDGDFVYLERASDEARQTPAWNQLFGDKDNWRQVEFETLKIGDTSDVAALAR